MFGEGLLNLMAQLPGTARRRRAWTAVAERRGGHYTPAHGGFFNRQDGTIDVPVGEVLVNTCLHTESGSDHSVTYTRVRAHFVLGVGPSFRIRRAGLIGRMGRALGLQDVAFGDPNFDREFIAKTATPDSTRNAVRPVVRAALMQLKGATLESNGHTVEFRVPEVYDGIARVELSIDLVGQVASHGSDWTAMLRSLPGSFVPPAGPWNHRSAPCTDLSIRGASLRVWLMTRAGLQLVVTTRLNRESSPFTLHTDQSGAPIDAPPRGMLDPESFSELQRLGAVTLQVVPGQAQVVLHGEADEARVMSVAGWLAGFAQGGRRRGAFR